MLLLAMALALGVRGFDYESYAPSIAKGAWPVQHPYLHVNWTAFGRETA